MGTVSNSFTAVGNGTALYIKDGDAFDYAVTGTFVATILLERSESNGAGWILEKKITAAESDRYIVNFKGAKAGLIRFRCSSFTSGTAVTSITDVPTAADGAVVTDAGAKNGSTVSVLEYNSGIVHKTVLSLHSTPLEVVSVTTGNGVGGVKIYDLPEGHIKILGCVANLSIAVETQDDFTDATPEGDIGIGTVSPANADALGTDATDDNIGTATAFTMDAYAASVNIAPDGDLYLDGTSTPADVYVTALVDAADIDDDVTTNLLISGTVTLSWINLGDY